MERIDQHRPGKNKWFGFILLLIGGGLLLRQMNLAIPDWIFSWKTLLIAIGIFIGIGSNFQRPAWFILILIGGIFLIEDLVPGLQWHHYAWPLVLILLGIFMIFRPGRHRWRNWQQWGSNDDVSTSAEKFTNEDVFDYTTFFGSLQKNVLTKHFRGGEAVTVFGGTELNFIQADIEGKVVLEVTQIFGGTKLILPAHWQVQSEMTSIFGGIEDKRPTQAAVDPGKILILKGTSIFGGIEIVSY